MARKIACSLPAHKVCVEPMAGGASVFFAKPPVEKEVLADKDPELMALYRAAKKGANCKTNVRSQAHERRLLRSRLTNPCHIAAKLRCSFAKMGRHPNRKKDYPCLVRWPAKRHIQRLKNVRLETGDFEATMRRHDSPWTLHYLDPPYHDLHNSYLAGIVDPRRIARVARNMRGSVVISYNDHPRIRKLFCGKYSPFKCRRIRQPILATVKGALGTRQDLLIVKE